jgi:hypothetical protein
MGLLWRAFGLVAALLIFTAAIGAAEYDTTFIGLSTEADLYFTPDAAMERISLFFTYGPETTEPVRFRGGLGYYPDRPFAVSAGIELPLFERLNKSRARFFGVYLISDLSLEIKKGVQFGATAGGHVLIPLVATGGISVGGGITESLEPFARVSFMSGVYPLATSRQSD